MLPNYAKRLFLFWLLLNALGCALTAQPPEVATPLAADTTIQRELNSKQSHLYQLALDTNQAVKIVAGQNGVDVVLQLIGADGKLIAETNQHNTQQAELLLWICPAAGYYQVKILASEKNTNAGKYELRADITAADAARKNAIEKFNEGVQLASNKNYQAALANFSESLNYWQTSKDSELTAETLRQIAMLQMQLRNAEKGIAAYEQSLAIWHDLDRKAEAAITLNNIGTAYANQGNYLRAQEYFRRVLALSEYLAPDDLASFYYNIGIAFQGTSQNQNALEYLQKALPLIRSLGEKDLELLALSDIGRTYYAMSEMTQALEYAQKGLTLSRLYKIPIREARLAQDMGRIYEALGDDEQALDFCQQALQIFHAEKYVGGETADLILIGDIQKNLGNINAARQSYELATTLAQANKLQEAAARAASRLSGVLLEDNEFSQAITYLQPVLRYFQSTGNRRSEINALLTFGRLYRKKGEYKSAEDYLQTALNLSQNSANGFADFAILTELAFVARDTGNLSQARRKLDDAIALYEAQRSKLISPSLSAGFIGQSNLYADKADILMQLHQQNPQAGFDSAAFTAAEQSRSRNLLDMLFGSHVDLQQSVDLDLLEKYRTLQKKLSEKDAALQKIQAKKAETVLAAKLQNEVNELSSQLKLAQAKLQATNPKFYELALPTPPNLQEIQQKVLDADTLLLEFLLGKSRSYVWVVANNSLQSIVLSGSTEIEAAARRYLDLLPKSPQRKYQRETQLAGQNLAQLILNPITPYLKKKRVLIVADGVLQYVPFAALPLPTNARNDETLLTKFEIVNLPSASVLTALRRDLPTRRAADKQLAIFSDPVFQANDPRVQIARTNKQTPNSQLNSESVSVAARMLTRSANSAGVTSFERLPYSRQEAENIAALVPQEQQLKALDFAASRTAAYNGHLEKYRIIHFATHSLLNSQHPELSGVVLSLVNEQGDWQDGFLRLNDLYNLKLNADLVVLSACNTALGKDIKGEGIVGLTRGFMYAGAARVVASLWNVNDAATAELMKQFYRAMLVEKQSPAAALRSAQLIMSSNPHWSSPYYWSGFTLQGEWK